MAPKMKSKDPRQGVDELRAQLQHVRRRIEHLRPCKPVPFPSTPYAKYATRMQFQSRHIRIEHLRAELKRIGNDIQLLEARRSARKDPIDLCGRVQALPQELIDVIEDYTFLPDNVERSAVNSYTGRSQHKKQLNILQVDHARREKCAREYYRVGVFKAVGMRAMLQWLDSLPFEHRMMLRRAGSLQCITWYEQSVASKVPPHVCVPPPKTAGPPKRGRLGRCKIDACDRAWCVSWYLALQDDRTNRFHHQVDGIGSMPDGTVTKYSLDFGAVEVVFKTRTAAEALGECQLPALDPYEADPEGEPSRRSNLDRFGYKAPGWANARDHSEVVWEE